MQVLNDGANEEDFKQLLEILKGFGQVEVLYDPSDPKDKDVTADEVVGRYENFKKWHNALNRKGNEETGKDGSRTEGCVTDKVYEITLYLMFNREFMNDVYRTFRIISRGL